MFGVTFCDLFVLANDGLICVCVCTGMHSMLCVQTSGYHSALYSPSLECSCIRRRTCLRTVPPLIVLCVCVCVCVFEREREREVPRVVIIGQSQLAKNRNLSRLISNLSRLKKKKTQYLSTP